MQSKTSYFNGTLFRKNLTRFCLLWIIYLGLWLVALPFNFLQSFNYENVMSWELQHVLLTSGVNLGVAVNFVYGLACALAIFSYLFSAKSANMIHAMPLRREELFLTNYVLGLLFAILPNLIIVVFTILAEAVIGIVLIQATLQWFLITTFSFVFFYSFAVFLTQLTGNGFFLPFIYGILNVTAIGVEGVIRSLLGVFVYGYVESGFGTMAKFSPLYYLEVETGIVGENVLYNTNDVLVNVHYVYDSWMYLIVLAVVGLIFAVVAFALYRHRSIESAGDVIAIRQLRPVFKYCFAVGFALIFSIMLYSFVQRPIGPVILFIEVACFMLIGTFIGYFLAEILLQKSFRVFRKGWLGFVVVSLCMLAMLTAIDCDLFGYEQYVPKADEIESVLVGYSENGAGSSDEKLIEKTLALHQRILQEKGEQEEARMSSYTYYNAIEDSEARVAEWYSETCNIEYTLKNGKIVRRCYEICCKQSDLDDSESLIRNYVSVFDDPIFVVLRFVPDLKIDSPQDIQYCNVNYQTSEKNQETVDYDDGYRYLSLTAEQAYELFTTCILPDLQDGLMGQSFLLEDTSEVTYIASIELAFRSGVREDEVWNYYYTPTIYSERTNAFLEKLGIELITEQGLKNQTND